MAMVLCKEGVSLKAVTPALAYMLLVLEQFARDRMGLPDLTITSIYDGNHLSNSRHYRGEAFDLRTRNLEVGDKEEFRVQLEDALNTHQLARDANLDYRFSVILEAEEKDTQGNVIKGEHLHVQVKKGSTFPGV